MTYARFGCADNVWTTRNGHGQDERVTAYARSQVYTADKARRDIGGALWDSETDDGVVRSRAERKELKLTRKIALRQECFRASWDDPERFGTLTGYYQACLKCL